MNPKALNPTESISASGLRWRFQQGLIVVVDWASESERLERYIFGTSDGTRLKCLEGCQGKKLRLQVVVHEVSISRRSFNFSSFSVELEALQVEWCDTGIRTPLLSVCLLRSGDRAQSQRNERTPNFKAPAATFDPCTQLVYGAH